MEDVVIRGVSLDRNQAKVTVAHVPDRPGVAARIFKALGDASINIDMIVQNVSPKGEKHTDISFTVDKAELAKAKKVMEPIAKELGAERVTTLDNIAKLSVVGVGMRSHSGVAASMFEALAEADVNIEMISTSEIKISIVIALDKAEKAANAVHQKFGLAGKVSN